MILLAVLLLVGCYLLGSIPTAYIAGRLIKGIDIRDYGSGNVGGTNVFETVSRWAVVPVGIADVAKGSIAVVAAQVLGLGLEWQMGAGLAAIVGHNWSVFLKFEGGRGVATSMGVLLFLAPREVVGFAALGLIGLLIHNLPLGVGLGMASLPFTSWWLQEPPAAVLGCVAMVVLVILKRLLSNPGTTATPGDWKSILINRLLLDRDIRNREAWINRVPSKSGSQDEDEPEKVRR